MVEPCDMAGRADPDRRITSSASCQGTRSLSTTLPPVAYTMAVDGKLAFAHSVNTRLKVTNLQVMAGEMGMGTPGVLGDRHRRGADRRGRDRRNRHRQFAARRQRGRPAGSSAPASTMLGKATMHGTLRTPTFAAPGDRAARRTHDADAVASGRRGGRPAIGSSCPTRATSRRAKSTGSGWINAVNQWEERTMQAISADGRTITLNSALQYDHLGARDLNGVLDFLPHVGNLTRNVIVRSESATGTRGHVHCDAHGGCRHPLRALQGSRPHHLSAAEHDDQLASAAIRSTCIT